jgi:hypothetical protein
LSRKENFGYQAMEQFLAWCGQSLFSAPAIGTTRQ